RKSSSYSGYDAVFDRGSEDLSIPYRRPKSMPFTSRITRFKYHRLDKLLPNVQVYEWNKDPEDHITRNWFDSLDPKSVDGFEELSNKFLEEFSQQKGMTKTQQRYMASSESQMKGFKRSWTVLRQKVRTSKECLQC
ncbi:hypothetical protein Tco_0297442, partial [Tanacetum coccineum]